MRLTATDKAIGEINMRKADIERAKALVEKYGNGGSDVADVFSGINEELALMDRCIEMLRSVQPAPKPEKPKAERKARRKKGEAE